MRLTRRDFVAALLASSVGAKAFAAAQCTADGAAESKENVMHPVFVVATITVKPGKRDEFVKIFKGNVPNVLAEDGCEMYEPVVDFDSGFSAQGPMRADVMTVMEKWESIEHLRAHLKAPHMNTYREAVKDIVVGSALQVLQPA